MIKIVTKEADDFAALVKSRIADHKAAELVKEEQTRARILKEVQDKLAREDEAKRREEENAAATAAMQGIEEARREEYLPAPMLDILEGVATNLIADLAVSRAATTSANVVPMRAAMPTPAPATPPTLKLGQIGERMGFNLTGAFLKNLGFEPAAHDKNAVLFHESDFPLICAALIKHIEQVIKKDRLVLT